MRIRKGYRNRPAAAIRHVPSDILASVWRGTLILFLVEALLFAQPAADTLFEKARALQMAGRLDEAESSYREYLKKYRARPEVLANLGALLARRESYPEAIRLYQQALQADPSLYQLHLNIGLAYLKQAQAARAITEFDLFLKSQPENAQARQLRALALLETERYPEAERQYRALLPSQDLTVSLGLATALVRQNKAAEAREILEPVLARGDSAEVQLAFGQILLQEGRIDEALDTLRRAQQLNPNLPQLRLAIGSVFWRKRETEPALAEWRAEYAAQQGSFEAAYTLGSALSLKADSQNEGEALLRKATALRPKNARANYQLAKLLWQRSKSAEALTFLQRATESDPAFREAFFLQANVLAALGRKAEAAKYFARVKELSAKELERQQDLFSESH